MSDGVVVSLITAAATIITALIARDVRRRVRGTESQLAAIQHEVKNSHGTNLRDDVDAVSTSQRATHEKLAAIHDQLGALTGFVHRLGDEATQARKEALADRKRLDALSDRVDDGLAEHATFREQLARLLSPARRRRPGA